MANYWRDRTKREQDEEEEEEQETLSLSDLPTNMVKTEEAELRRESDEEEVREQGEDEEEERSSIRDKDQLEKEEAEFEFGWWGNNGPCGSSESRMSAADELFFKGQILPLRLSVSSDNGLICRSMSRSESMDHGSVSRFIGSRSSSIGSYHSSTSSSSTNSNSAAMTRLLDLQNPQFRNNGHFHKHPSGPNPRPTINGSSQCRQSSLRSTPSHGRFSLWDFFRTGLVRGPTTEFHGSRNSNSNNKRTAISRNGSNGSSSNGNGNGSADVSRPKPKRNISINISSIGGLLGVASCKCSVVETVALNGPKSVGPATAVGDVRVRKDRTRGGERRRRRDSVSRQRTSEWLLKEMSLSYAS